MFGRYIAYSHSGQKRIKLSLEQYLKEILSAGVGEIFLNSIDRDGSYLGYDLELINKVSSSSLVPLVACGGARDINDIKSAIKNGASAAAAGSMFVYSKKGKGVLINYPDLKNVDLFEN